MVRVFNIRRSIAFTVIAVLLFAALAPACLMAPAIAMGMPSGSATAAENNCERGATDGSMSACPYTSNNDGTGTVPQDQTPTPVVASAAATVQVFTDFGSVRVTPMDIGAAPPGAPVPLRL